MSTKPPFLSLAQKLINTALYLDPFTLALVAQLSGRTLAVEITDWDCCVLLVPHQYGLVLKSLEQKQADTLIKGQLATFASLLANPQLKQIKHSLEISGDFELGQEFARIFKNLHIDMEQQISRFSGDLVAHRLAKVIRRVHGVGLQIARKFFRDTPEYLQEELKVLMPPLAAADHYAQVDDLSARLEQLQQRLKPLLRQVVDAEHIN